MQKMLQNNLDISTFFTQCFSTMASQVDIEQEVTQIFKDSGALLEGHFILRSGLRSGHFFQCAAVGQYMDKITRLAELLIHKLQPIDCDTVLAPAMGGLVIGQEVARQLGKRFIFAEKKDDKLVLRRGFKIAKDEKILLIEDVITRGGRVQEALDIVATHKGIVSKIGILVDRSHGQVSFSVPHVALLNMSFPTYEAHNLPQEVAQIPPIKPGS